VALALGTAALVLVALLCELWRPRATCAARALLASRRARRSERAHGPAQIGYDPGRELRAEHRARELLRSCVDPADWEMYRDLGFLRVSGRLGDGAPGSARYAYLIYPHRPIVAFVPGSGQLLNEYCVEFPDHSRPYGSARLPDSDDVLAKWMALTADERGLIGGANMHLPGRQIDPDLVRRDLRRLARWERERARGQRGAPGRPPRQASAQPPEPVIARPEGVAAA
jgi:hypothetical protein